MSIVRGNGQFAPGGQLLPDRLEVAVREIGDQEPVEDVIVEWEVIEGQGATLEEARTLTDAQGIASNRLRLGEELGTYRVRARLRNAEGVLAEFEAFAVLPPVLESLPPQALSGETIQIQGRNFSPTPWHNVVLFSGIRGRVESSELDRLRVEVPRCLPDREVDVSLSFGEVESNTLQMTVFEASSDLELEIGQDTLLTDTDGSACVRLPGSTRQASYMLVVQSAGRIAGARYDIGVRGRIGNVPADGPSALVRAPPLVQDRLTLEEAADAQTRWDTFLRLQEERLVADPTLRPASPARAPASAAPAVGDVQSFRVINADSEFETVTARLTVIGERGLFFVDERAEGSLTEEAVQGFSAQLDEPIAAAITDAYGATSDLDGNDKVVVLLTPVVNELTERGDDGYVAGFFFGLDLLQGTENSNEAEIFYLVVPDPSGVYSDPRTLASLQRTLPPVLAHELQHMVHFNQRVLLRDGSGTDALWLSEGLATMAEDVAGIAAGSAALVYQDGNYRRASRYLSDPNDVSLIVSSGSGSLAERGAGWLFVRYLWERFGGNPVLGALTQATVTGIDNVEDVTGVEWSHVFSDWGAAVESEFQGWGSLLDERHRYPQINLSSAFNSSNLPQPRAPRTVGNFEFDDEVRLWSGGTQIFLVQVSSTRKVALNLGAPSGGPLTPESRGQLRVIRVQ